MKSAWKKLTFVFRMSASRNWIYIFLIGVIFLVSCRRKVVSEQFVTIPELGWSTDSTVILQAGLYDTAHYHDIYLLFRINGDYRYSNFYSHFDIVTPTGKKISDRKNLVVSRKDGKWLGSGMGDLRSFKFIIQKDFIVRDTGMYHFNIEQHMRERVIHGIRDVGVLVVKGDEII